MLSRQVPPTSLPRSIDEEVVAAVLGQPDRGAEAGEAAADDEHVDVPALGRRARDAALGGAAPRGGCLGHAVEPNHSLNVSQ